VDGKNDVKKLQEFCIQNQLDNIKITGHLPQKQIVPYLYAADVLILAIQKDTSPLKLFEYMASKRPIVASSIPSTQNILKDNYNAILAEVDNPISFKNAIIRILTNPSLANRISDQAFQDVQHHTWEKRADKILDFLNDHLSVYRKNKLAK
jgi:glycosyltransferase involved in cell wall biosynthesis